MDWLDLKSERLRPQFGIVEGVQRSGKTSLCAAWICDDYKYHRAERMRIARDLTDEYERLNNIRLVLPEHLYYSNISITLDPKNNVRTHNVDVHRMGIPNDQYDVQYFPPGSVIFIQEADTQLWCRDWSKLPEYILQFFKLFGHLILTILFDTQCADMLDKAVRQLATDEYFVRKSYQYRRFRRWGALRSDWDIQHVYPQHVRMAESMHRLGVRFRIPTQERIGYTYRGNVFERYNSYSGRALFLAGIDNPDKHGFRTIPHSGTNLSVAGINRYVADHPIGKPAETQRGFEPPKPPEKPSKAAKKKRVNAKP